MKKATLFLAILFILSSLFITTQPSEGVSLMKTIWGDVYFNDSTPMGGAVVTGKILQTGETRQFVSYLDISDGHTGHYQLTFNAMQLNDIVNITVKKDNVTFYYPEFYITQDDMNGTGVGNLDIICTNILNEGRPTAVIDPLNQNVQVGEVVLFNASLSRPYNDTFTLYSYSWDFGDGNIGDGMVVSHQYNTTGTYKVTLTVMQINNTDIKSSTMEGTVYVSALGVDGWSSSEIFGVSIIVLGALIMIGITTGIILYLTSKRRNRKRI